MYLGTKYANFQEKFSLRFLEKNALTFNFSNITTMKILELFSRSLRKGCANLFRRMYVYEYT